MYGIRDTACAPGKGGVALALGGMPSEWGKAPEREEDDGAWAWAWPVAAAAAVAGEEGLDLDDKMGLGSC